MGCAGWWLSVRGKSAGGIMQLGDYLMKREFYMMIERDEDGYYIGEVPQLRACYSQGKTLDELMQNIREVIALCLEDEEDTEVTEFIGVQKITV
jgi:predicted RNase H-like HicB family nuclease